MKFSLTQRRIGLLYLLLAATGFAFLPILTRAIYAESDLRPTDIAVWRFTFAAPLIWIMVRVRNSAPQGTERLPRVKLMALGIVYAVGALAAFFGLERIPASTYIVLFYTYPSMVALMSLFLGIRIHLFGWIALAMTLLGIILTVPNFTEVGNIDPVGVLFALINAAAVAVYFLLSGRVMRGITSLVKASAYVITGTLIVLLVIIPLSVGVQVPDAPVPWLLLLTFGFVSTAMPIFATNVGIQKVGAAQASIVSSVEPVITMTMAVLLLSEVVLGVQWLGAALIIGGVILLELPALRRARARIR